MHCPSTPLIAASIGRALGALLLLTSHCAYDRHTCHYNIIMLPVLYSVHLPLLCWHCCWWPVCLLRLFIFTHYYACQYSVLIYIVVLNVIIVYCVPIRHLFPIDPNLFVDITLIDGPYRVLLPCCIILLFLHLQYMPIPSDALPRVVMVAGCVPLFPLSHSYSWWCSCLVAALQWAEQCITAVHTVVGRCSFPHCYLLTCTDDSWVACSSRAMPAQYCFCLLRHDTCTHLVLVTYTFTHSILFYYICWHVPFSTHIICLCIPYVFVRIIVVITAPRGAWCY